MGEEKTYERPIFLDSQRIIKHKLPFQSLSLILDMKTIPIEVEKNLKLIIRIIEIELAFRQKDLDKTINPVSVKSLVEISGMSERSLRDWFKEYKGISISEYIKKRQIEYGARIFRLFPNATKKEVADILGLSSSQSLYPFMKRGGIMDMDELRGKPMSTDLIHLSFRLEKLSESLMFYNLEETNYEICAVPEYEASHWDKIEEFVKSNFPMATKVGDVGFAIDRYVENKIDEGIFISGILYRNLDEPKSSRGLRDDISWRKIPSGRYAVFTHKGMYDSLSSFYQSVLYALSRQDRYLIEKSLLIMEKYVNSPVDTPTEELITEIWVPIVS